MKNIFIIIMLINFGSYKNTTVTINEIDITTVLNQSPSLAEQYYDRLEIKDNLPKMLNSFLDRKALVRTEVPSSLWQTIKDSIDYNSFKTQIIDLIPNFYTDSELQSLLNIYSDKPKVPISKLNFRQELATKSQNFIDTEFLNTVNIILSSNGYLPL